MKNRKLYPKSSHRSDPRYAPRTRVRPAYSEGVDIAASGFGYVSSDVSRTSTPRVRARLSLYKRLARAAESFVHFLSSLSRFASICVLEMPRSPGIILEPRGKSRDPEDPEKCGSRAEALPARSSIFVEIFQIC